MRWLRQKKQSKPILTSPLARQLRIQAVRRARRARWEAVILTPLLVGILWAYYHREQLFGVDLPVRVVCVVALVILGWAFARALGGALGPMLLRRVEPGTAGTIGFLIRLIALTTSVLIALRVAGLSPQSLAVGGAFTAVIVGLAAQQTFGNLIAGMVLLSARPFRVGDFVRFQAGALAGQVEGSVISLGLLYTTLSQGEDRTMVPNSVVLSAAVVPLREPASVDLRARLRPDIKPSYVQEVLDEAISIPTRSRPHIGLEEVDSDEVIMRIAATPESGSDGPKLADEILAAVGRITDGETNGNGRWAPAGQPEHEDKEDRPERHGDHSRMAHTPSGGWNSGNPD
jgi:small conductance mechanosensitive channel